MGGTRFMVQWEEHPSHLATRLGQLLEHQTLVDVTLMCNTHTLRVHRAVLAACSPYFETILQRQLGMYPLIVLKDMQFSVLKSLIEFMYCGETSVTEDNLSALLQAAKFFQVKGLSAMTKEALGLTSTPKPAATAVNGDAARKAFVGRSKRVGMQQTFVAGGLKNLATTSHSTTTPASSTSVTTTGKTIFQTTPKSVPIRQDVRQQQTDTAQLLLSLSGGEFPKQTTFQTVSKNVRFHHGVPPSSAVTVEPSRTCPLDSSIMKNKESAGRSEVIERVPVVTPSGGVKPASVTLPPQIVTKTEPEKVENPKEDLTSQMFFVKDGPCKRGRPLKREMNLVFQEKVLTDAEMALQKEAEASRKALEMLQQEMATGEDTPATQVTETVQKKIMPVKQPLSKLQTPQNVNSALASRILPKESTAVNKQAAAKSNIVTQVTAVSTPAVTSQNVIYQVAGNTVPAIDTSSNETNIVYQLQEGVVSNEDTSGATNIVYQVADSTVVSAQDASSQNIIYQVADNAGTSEEGNSNTNIIYQVTDSSGTTSSSTMMEVLKEAGLPTDAAILLESSDGSYVTVNEEVLMNIMNGGMIQVGDGSIVGGEGVQFIVQEIQEVNEGQMEATVEQPASTEMMNVEGGESQALASAESGVDQTIASTESGMDQTIASTESGVDQTIASTESGVDETIASTVSNVSQIVASAGSILSQTSAVCESNVNPSSTSVESCVNQSLMSTGSIIEPVHQSLESVVEQVYVTETNESIVEPVPVTTVASLGMVKHTTYKPARGHQNKSNAKVETRKLPSLEENETISMELPAAQNENVTVMYEAAVLQDATNQAVSDRSGVTLESVPMEVGSKEVLMQAVVVAPAHSDEIITGDSYGEEAMEGFAVMEAKERKPATKMDYVESDTADFVFPEQSCSSDALTKPFPAAKPVNEGKVQELPGNGTMSVEQALQAMMGDGSDTEMEVCTNTATDGTTKVKPVISHHDTKGRGTSNEGSIDEETEDLRLVLSPEDESVKVEDESQSAEGSLHGSFTLALSSPDSTGNEKNLLETETLLDSSESDPKGENISTELETEDKSVEPDIQIKLIEPSTQSKSTEMIPEIKSTMSMPEIESSESLPEVESNSFGSRIKSDKSERRISAGDEASETNLAETAVSASLMKQVETVKTGGIGKVYSPQASLHTTTLRKTNQHIPIDILRNESDTCAENTEHSDVSAVDKPTETSIESDALKLDKADRQDRILISDDDDTVTSVQGSGTGNAPLDENSTSVTDESQTAGSAAKNDGVSDDGTIDDKVANKEEDHTISAISSSSGDTSVNVSRSEVGKSLPILSDCDADESDILYIAESDQKQIKCSTTTSTGSDVLVTSDSKIDNVPDDENAKKIRESAEAMLTIGTEGVRADHIELLNLLTAETEDKDEMRNSKSLENEEVSELTSESLNADETKAESSGGEGAVKSPTKDIPYAVGLLPLRTALEKLQAMPEYQPRKTRSASSGKESGIDAPACRHNKRKASSSTESLEKKMKPSEADDGDGTCEIEGNMTMVAEEFDESIDENQTSEICIDEGQRKTESPVSETNAEVGMADNKVEPLPSMMELVSDSNDVV